VELAERSSGVQHSDAGRKGADEQARYSPSLEMAFQIARVFGVALDQVFQSSDGKRRAVSQEKSRITSMGTVGTFLKVGT